MMNLSSPVSTRQQCEWLNINRSTLYYQPQDTHRDDTLIANRIYEIWQALPFYGYRRLTAQLQREGHPINHKRVKRMMDDMGLRALYPKPRLSAKDGARPWPYLLKDLVITHPNQVWSTDITYIRLPSGFVYLAAMLDVYSRRVMSWGISNTMEAEFCLDVLERGLRHYPSPLIVNSDQGSQYTSQLWIQALEESGIRISMDGKGRWADNVHVERLWRTIKYENIRLCSHHTIKDLKTSVGEFISFYNMERLHQSLEYHTPDEVYRGVWSPAPLVHFSHRKEVSVNA